MFDTPTSCAGMQPDALMSDCPDVVEYMRVLVKSHCEASKAAEAVPLVLH